MNTAAKKFGSQTIVIGIDFKLDNNGNYSCVSNSSKQIRDKNPLDWAVECANRGAGEIILTSIDNDGVMKGYEFELIEQISNKIQVPIIASGGAGNYNHMLKAFKCGASAVAAASIYHFTEQTPSKAKEFLNLNKIPVRKNLNLH